MLGQLDLTPQDAQILDRGGHRLRQSRRSHRGGANLRRNVEPHRTRPQSRSAGGTTRPAPAPVVSSAPFTTPQQARTLITYGLFGEALRVGKEKVSAGEVHVRKESVTHMETVQVRNSRAPGGGTLRRERAAARMRRMRFAFLSVKSECTSTRTQSCAKSTR